MPFASPAFHKIFVKVQVQSTYKIKLMKPLLVVINNPAQTSAAGTILCDLRLKGTDNYYLSGMSYRLVQHSWTEPQILLGGFIQAPSGPLAPFFTGGFSWLRESDVLDFDGSIYRLTKTWKGAPSGHRDADLYAAP